MKKLITKTMATLFVTGIFTMATHTVSAQISTAHLTVNDTSAAASGIIASGAGADNAFCNTPGGNTTLSVTGGHLGTNAHWGWYENTCPADTASSALHTGDTYDVSIANTGTEPISKTYYVRAEGGTCAPSECTPVTIVIYPTPVVTTTLDSLIYCDGTSVPAIALQGNPTGSGGAPVGDAVSFTYTVTGDDIGISGTDIAAANNQIPGFTATNNGSTTLTATITITPHANGCDGHPVSYVITINPAITITATVTGGTPTQALCNGLPTQAVTFTSNVTDGIITYQWTNDNAGIGTALSGDGNLASFTATNTNCGPDDQTAGNGDITGHFSVTATYINTDGNTSTCAVSPATFDITVHPTPNGKITVPEELCAGETVQLTYTADCATVAPYTLEINDGAITEPVQIYNSVQSGTAFDVTPEPVTAGEHTYNLMKITDANGCVKQ